MTKTNAVEKALRHYRETHNYPDNMWQTFLHLRRIKQINPSPWCFVQKIKVKWTQNQRRGNYITYEQSKRIKDIYEECQKGIYEIIKFIQNKNTRQQKNSD